MRVPAATIPGRGAHTNSGVGLAATRSDAFRTHWAIHNVRFHATAIKLFNHPVAGELSLSFNRMERSPLLSTVRAVAVIAWRGAGAVVGLDRDGDLSQLRHGEPRRGALL